ncbi:MAG: GNAT family N-acetyltransferase [Oscillospiraceae bacterium]|nr:GNAT family N-acetyltransferase [Oscillospiraceae bacterium]
MNIKKLNIDECELFSSIDRSEKIRAAWQINKDRVRSLDFTYLDIEGYGFYATTCIEILRKVINQGGIVYGAFEDNRIVGIASVLPVSEKADGFSVLVSVDVSSEYRRKGIGHSLIDKCAEHSKSVNCSTMLVASNPYESTIKFFKSYGFLYIENPQNKALLQENLYFPKFEFPPPFDGLDVEQPIFLELPLNEYQAKDYFCNRITLDELDKFNCYGATRLAVTDRQMFSFGDNPVTFMATYRYDWMGEKHRMLVACFDSFPVGFIGYGGVDDESVFIEPMMVDASFQKRGIASKMLELFECRIRSANKYKGIGIGNRTDNIAAGRTYEKAGFVLTKLDGLSVYRYKELV